MENQIYPIIGFQESTDYQYRLTDALNLSCRVIGDRCERVEIDRTGIRVIISRLKSFHVMPESVEIICIREEIDRMMYHLYPLDICPTTLFLTFVHRRKLYALRVTGGVILADQNPGLGFEVSQRYEIVPV